MKHTTSVIILFFITIFSCSVESEKINYGSDSCHFCQMTIVDQQHASEIVTNKGKVFKYDAIECMINDLKKKEGKDIALFFVNDYTSPGALIDAKAATYLISPQIKSPMGAFLSGFSSKEDAQETQKESGGELYNWNEVQSKIN